MKSAVEKGFEFETRVLSVLHACNIKAWRTNSANPDDPKQYKAGFDGGVDIIARYSTNEKISKEYVFYIQCKHWNKELNKSAISEVYAGMHFRAGFSKGSIPVVIADCNATEETRHFAKSLVVELVLKDEIGKLNYAKNYNQVPYVYYGVFMTVMFYCITKNRKLLNKLPDTFSEIEEPTLQQTLIEETQSDFERIQAKYDAIESKELRLQRERQEALDLTKMAVMRNIHTVDYYRNQREKEMPKITLEDG